MASLHVRLFLALALVLGLTSHVGAQNSGIDDLPDCAAPCAKNAAALVNCALTDVACLCSHDQFTSSTESCANTGGVCPIEDRSSVGGILDNMCAQAAQSSSSTSSTATSTTATTSSSTTSTGITKTTSTSTSTSTSPTPTSTSRTDTVTLAATPTPTAATLTLGVINNNTLLTGGLTTTPTPTGSSTLVVVQTVDLPQTSALNAGALRVDGGVGAYAVLPMILAMAGGLLL